MNLYSIQYTLRPENTCTGTLLRPKFTLKPKRSVRSLGLGRLNFKALLAFGGRERATAVAIFRERLCLAVGSIELVGLRRRGFGADLGSGF